MKALVEKEFKGKVAVIFTNPAFRVDDNGAIDGGNINITVDAKILVEFE